mgnify:FL=1
MKENKNKGKYHFSPGDELQQEAELVPHQSQIKKSILNVSVVCCVIAILTSFLVTSFLDDGSAEEVVANRISTSTSAGESLFMNETYANIEARDFEVSNAGPDGGNTRMLIWDFNLEDFDEVAILVDGIPVKEKLIISSNAASISIPVPSTITISGVKDNGGGISYAVKFPNNKTTYFNTVTVGQLNNYTVLPSI